MKSRRSSLRRLALAAAALLAGCTMIPTYQRPLAPVAASFPDAGASAPTTSPAAVNLDWQQFFSDARLKYLIGLALQNNRDLQVAILNIEQARAQYQIRRADQFPTLNLGATYLRSPNTSGDLVNSYVAGLSVTSYEIDFFGRISSLSQSALLQYLATEEARKTVQISLIAAVANGYLAVVADEELLALARETLETREESLKLTRLRFDNGVSSELDQRQAESLVEGAKVALAFAQRQRMQDENALVLLVGEPVTISVPSGASLVGRTIGPELPAGLPSDLLANRPDVRQSEQQLRAANANIGAARAAFFPRITLTGAAGIASGDLLDLFKSGSLAWTLGAGITVPIFDAGRNQANLDVAMVTREIGVAQYQKAVQTAFREVADALAGRATLTEQLRAQTAQAAAEQARYDLANLRYKNGIASSLDLLDSQRALFVTQIATIQVKLAQLQNQVTLYKVLGGGWTEPPAVTSASASP